MHAFVVVLAFGDILHLLDFFRSYKVNSYEGVLTDRPPYSLLDGGMGSFLFISYGMGSQATILFCKIQPCSMDGGNYKSMESSSPVIVLRIVHVTDCLVIHALEGSF